LVATQTYPDKTYCPGSIGGAGGTTENMLGNDVYGDWQFSGIIYEFRIWNGALSPSQVMADYVAGPNTLPGIPPALSIGQVGNAIVLSWPADYPGYSLQTSPTLGMGASWMALPGSVNPVFTNGTYQTTLTNGSQASFYRLTK